MAFVVIGSVGLMLSVEHEGAWTLLALWSAWKLVDRRTPIRAGLLAALLAVVPHAIVYAELLESFDGHGPAIRVLAILIATLTAAIPWGLLAMTAASAARPARPWIFAFVGPLAFEIPVLFPYHPAFLLCRTGLWDDYLSVLGRGVLIGLVLLIVASSDRTIANGRVVFMLPVVLCSLSLFFPLSNVNTHALDGPDLTLGVVATSAPPGLTSQQRVREAARLSDFNESVDVVVWPESAIQDSLLLGRSYSQFAPHVNAQILAGGIVSEREGESIAAILLDESRTLIAVRRKRRLIWGVERAPPHGLGRADGSFSIGDAKVLALLCYEGLFADSYNSTDADLVVVLSNADWIGERMARLFADSIRLQAIANSVPTVLVSNNGLTMVVDSSGNAEMLSDGQAGHYVVRLRSGDIDPEIRM